MEEVVNFTTPMHVAFSHIKHLEKFSHIKRVQTTKVEITWDIQYYNIPIDIYDGDETFLTFNVCILHIMKTPTNQAHFSSHSKYHETTCNNNRRFLSPSLKPVSYFIHPIIFTYWSLNIYLLNMLIWISVNVKLLHTLP
jgi:hypothetical protein